MKLTTILLIGVLLTGSAVAESTSLDGAAVFKARCARCHGESGKTDTADARALKVRPLANDAKLAQQTPASIVEAIKSSPKHQGVGAIADLDDTELRAAAAFVRELAKQR